jgi:hypothetical protein
VGTLDDAKPVATEVLPEVAWEIDGSQFGEQPHRQPDLALLSELARRSGGMVDPSADDLRPLMHQESEVTPYSHELVLVALILLLLEFMLRIIRVRYSKLKP